MDSRITITGNLGSEVAHKVLDTSSGEIPFASFRVASTPRIRRYNDWQDGNTTWFTVNCYRQLAQHVHNSMHKGDPVIVIGKVRTQEWQDNEGNTRSKMVIEAEYVGHNLVMGESQFTKRRKLKTILTEKNVEAAQLAA